MAEKITAWMKVTAINDDEKNYSFFQRKKENNYSKVKRLLCNFLEVRELEVDEKAKTITIKVISSDIQTLISEISKKGRKIIKHIETIAPPQCEAQKSKKAEKPKEPKHLETGQSSQPMTMMQDPMMGPPMSYGSYYNPPPTSSGSNYYQPVQNYEYPSRSIYNSNDGNNLPPQLIHPYRENGAFDQFSDDNTQGCFIM